MSPPSLTHWIQLRWFKKIGLSSFWAPLIGTLGFFAILLCLVGALWLSSARFEPDFPQYLDHIQQRLTPIIDAVHKSSAPIDRLSNWLNPGSSRQVSIRGPSIVEVALGNAPKFLAILIVVHVLAFFLLLYGARLLKKLVDMIPAVSDKQNVVEIAAEIEQTAARYFTSVTLINAGLGVSVWICVALLGLPHPLLWGVAAFLLHYFPFSEQPVASSRWRLFHSFILIRSGTLFCRRWLTSFVR
jgi:predicted PurR-regulated permease PerM